MLVKSDEHALEDDASVEDVEDGKVSMKQYFGNEQEHWLDCKIPEIVIVESLCCLKDMFSNVSEVS